MTWTSWMTWGWVNYQQVFFVLFVFNVNYSFKLQHLALNAAPSSQLHCHNAAMFLWQYMQQDYEWSLLMWGILSQPELRLKDLLHPLSCYLAWPGYSVPEAVNCIPALKCAGLNSLMESCDIDRDCEHSVLNCVASWCSYEIRSDLMCLHGFKNGSSNGNITKW